MKFNLLLFLAIFILVGCESKNHVLFSKNQELTNIINNNQKSIYRYKIKPYDRISVLFYEHPDLSTRKVGDFQEVPNHEIAKIVWWISNDQIDRFRINLFHGSNAILII